MFWQTRKLEILIVALVVIGVAVLGWLYPHFLPWLTLLVLTLTLTILIWYAYDTNRIANELVAQTELEMRPVICLYIRNLSGVSTKKVRQSIKENYAITHLVGKGIVSSPYYVALLNVGNGPAFNISLESENFVGWKYQTRFFAPRKDEHAVKIVRKPSNKIRNLSELKEGIFTVRCQAITGKWYEYKYKIVDVEERVVEFIL